MTNNTASNTASNRRNERARAATALLARTPHRDVQELLSFAAVGGRTLVIVDDSGRATAARLRHGARAQITIARQGAPGDAVRISVRALARSLSLAMLQR